MCGIVWENVFCGGKTSQKVETCVGLCGKMFSVEVKRLKKWKDVSDCVGNRFLWRSNVSKSEKMCRIVWKNVFCGGKTSQKLERCEGLCGKTFSVEVKRLKNWKDARDCVGKCFLWR